MSNPLASLRHVYDVEPPPSAGDPATDSVETALLEAMRRTLDAAPTLAPTDASVEAVLAQAAAASQGAQPLYDAYASDAPLSGEDELLRQSRLALDRLSAERPAPRPTDAVEAWILARAAEASSLPAEAVPDDAALVPLAAAYGFADANGVEADLLDTTRAALDRLPVAQPDPSALDAILAQAARASAPEAPAPRPVAADRGAAPRDSRRRFGGVWAGAAGLLAAVVVAVVAYPMLATEPPAEVADAPLAASVDAVETETLRAEAAAPALVAPTPQASVPLAVAQPARVVRRTAPRGPSAPDPVPVVQRAAALAAPAPLPEAPLLDAEADLDVMPAWDVDDDVRLLSIRLQELRRQNEGLAWDEPAAAFGAPALGSAPLTPGIQAVREGAAPERARVRVRSDSARSNQ